MGTRRSDARGATASGPLIPAITSGMPTDRPPDADTSSRMTATSRQRAGRRHGSGRDGFAIRSIDWSGHGPPCHGRQSGESRCSGLCHDRRVSPAAAARTPRVRLDQLLVERGLAESRARAQALVLAGKVGVGEGDAARHDRKPGELVAADVPVDIVEPEPYVSRGGHKLAAALDAFEIDPPGSSAWTSDRRPAASPTSCCSAARAGSTLSTWVAGNWPNGCDATRESCRWSGRTPGT